MGEPLGKLPEHCAGAAGTKSVSGNQQSSCSDSTWWSVICLEITTKDTETAEGTYATELRSVRGSHPGGSPTTAGWDS